MLMNSKTSKTESLQLIQTYVDLGWDLVTIPSGSKGPTFAHWNQKSIQPFPLDWDGNIGIKHPFCKQPTGAFDIDELGGTRQYLAARNLNLDTYLNAPDSVQIVSGRPGRAKLLYRMPIWCDRMRTRKITKDNVTLFEFRSATKNGLAVQDVLPDSIHPTTGKPYIWKGDFTKLPEFPTELIQLWMELNKPRPRGTWVHSEVKDAEVEAALNFIDPDLSRDAWVKVAMSLHSYDPDAIDLFDKWSAKGAKYVGTDIQSVWSSFDASEDGITIATLFKYARDAGWSGYIVPIEQVFGASKQPVQEPTPVPGLHPKSSPIPVIEEVQDGNWSEPEPLPHALVAVDAFDELWLPESLRPWISDVAERIQCPPVFPAVGAMVSLANTLGRKIAIRPKKQDDWMEVPQPVGRYCRPSRHYEITGTG